MKNIFNTILDAVLQRIFVRSVITGMIIATLAVSTNSFAGEQSSFNSLNSDRLSKVYGAPKININLGDNLLGIARFFIKQDDPETAEILRDIRALNIKIYNLNADPDTAFKEIDRATKIATKQNWLALVSVNEPQQKVRIFSRLKDDRMDGLLVFVVNSEDKEIVFIDIVGSINTADLATLTNAMDIDMKSKI
jgi:hypothetical protein